MIKATYTFAYQKVPRLVKGRPTQRQCLLQALQLPLRRHPPARIEIFAEGAQGTVIQPANLNDIYIHIYMR